MKPGTYVRALFRRPNRRKPHKLTGWYLGEDVKERDGRKVVVLVIVEPGEAGRTWREQKADLLEWHKVMRNT